jgi:hypothetical protein
LKDYLQLIAAQGLTGLETENVQNNIRTAQAGSGLLYGGVAAKQEAQTVGRLTQSRRLNASSTLADLTLAEHMLPLQLSQLFAQTEKSSLSAALPQLSSPVNTLASLYQGTSSGLGSIFNLSSLY